MIRVQRKSRIILSIGIFAYSSICVSSNCDQTQNNTIPVSIVSIPPVSGVPVLNDTDINSIKNTSCEVNITAAKGEYEPASIVINTKEAQLGNAEISSTDLISENGKISATNVEIKVVKVWYQAAGAWSSIGRSSVSMFADDPMLVPELLLNDERVVSVDKKIKKNVVRIVNSSGQLTYKEQGDTKRKKEPVMNFAPTFEVSDANVLQPVEIENNKQFWITVYIPKTTPPGDYRGEIILSNKNNKSATIPVKVKVLPFELSEPKLEYSMYYTGRLNKDLKPSVSSYFKSKDQLKIEFKDMLDHGIKNPVVYQHPFENAKLFQDYLSIRKEMGIDNSVLYMMFLNTDGVDSKKELATLKTNIINVQKATRRFGTDLIYVYGKDEAKDEELKNQRKAWEVVHKQGAKVYAAGYQGSFELVGDLLDILVYAQAPILKEAEKFHSVNHKIFSYANPQSGVENPYIYRQNYGVVLWAAKFDGAMIYAYQYSFGDGWNDFDHAIYRDHNLTYPTSNGVIKTMAWEGLREGIDDVRYLTILEQLIEVTQSKGSSELKIIAAQANEYLINLRNQLNKENEYKTQTKMLNIDLNKIRGEIIKFILALS